MHAFSYANDGPRYRRIVDRVLVRAKSHYRRNAIKLLALVASAIRPLKWHEVQAAISFDSAHGSADFLKNRLAVGAKDLCGALLEELPNGDIDFVHSTAKL